MIRSVSSPLRVSLLALLCLFASSQGEAGERTMVLPLRAIGVEEATAQVSRSLLAGELESLGYTLVSTGDLELPVCDELTCAREYGRRFGAERVVYGSLNQLGSKVIARIRSFRMEADSLDYNDQLNAATPEDLDVVMSRVAEGIASGRGASDRVTVDSVLMAEVEAPRLRQGRRGFGARAGFLFPTGDAFGGADRLTGIRFPFKFERERFFVETTTLLGVLWGNGSADWSLLDIFAARYFSVEDTSFYLGAGVGIHAVHVEGTEFVSTDSGPGYNTVRSQSSTSPSFDVGGGVSFLRTYDFQLHLDLRYHVIFEDFEQTGGDGAHGLLVTIGTGR